MICSKLLITHSFIPFTPPLSSSLLQLRHVGMPWASILSALGGAPPESGFGCQISRWYTFHPWSGPEAEQCGWVWEEKCSTYTWMAPLFKKNPEFTERGLQGSGTNEAAGIFLARYKLPFSWLEAAASTSYYFTEWKGLAINDAIMLMVLPSCMFACPCLVSINPGEEWEKEKHHCRLREEKRPRIWASLFKTH